MADEPGSAMPRASASAFMVDAVPMVLQCPADGVLCEDHVSQGERGSNVNRVTDPAQTISINVSSSISPAACRSLAFHKTVPEPILSLEPRRPLSMGPTLRQMAGIFCICPKGQTWNEREAKAQTYHSGRCHQKCWGGLVTPSQKHDTIQRICMQ